MLYGSCFFLVAASGSNRGQAKPGTVTLAPAHHAAGDRRNLDALEAQATSKGFGVTTEEKRVAGAVAQILRDYSGPGGQARTAAVIIGGPPRRAVIVSEIETLKEWPMDNRQEALEKVRGALLGILGPRDWVAVGLKGSWFYGAVGSGNSGGEWVFDISSLALDDPLIDALAMPKLDPLVTAKQIPPGR